MVDHRRALAAQGTLQCVRFFRSVSELRLRFARGWMLDEPLQRVRYMTDG